MAGKSSPIEVVSLARRQRQKALARRRLLRLPRREAQRRVDRVLCPALWVNVSRSAWSEDLS